MSRDAVRAVYQVLRKLGTCLQGLEVLVDAISTATLFS